MEWYEYIIGVIVWLVGFWLWTKYKEIQKRKYHNDSWRTRDKK